MSGIFVNYRQNYYPDPGSERRMRRPHGQVVEALAERLANHFGPERVFLDKELRPASRYPNELRAKVKTSELVVAVIHDAWLEDIRDRARRLGPEATDWVRYELATAFGADIHVLPVLIDTARLPGKDELFDDIGELGLCQALRIQPGHWRRDVNRILVEAERYVSTEPPPEPEQEERTAPRRWWWCLPLVTGLIGLLAPAVLTGLLVTGAPDRTVLLTVLAASLLFGLIAVLGMVSIVYAARSWLDVLDHQAAAMSHELRTNVIVGLTIFGLATTFLVTSDMFTPVQHIFLLAIVAGIVVTLGAKWLRDQGTAGQWPLPSLAADPAAIRGAQARLTKHLAETAPLMTRVQRDQARFALDQLDRSMARLRALCQLDRRGWLRTRSLWLTALHTALLAGTVGASAAALLAYLDSGGRHWSAPVWSGGCVVLAMGCFLAAVDRGYRLQKWRRKVVIDAVPAALEGLERRLLEISVQPSRHAPVSR